MTALVVPIDVAALCVGQPDVAAAAEGLAAGADFSQLPYAASGMRHNPGPYVSAQALAPGAPFEGQVPLAGGVHLHWALPDGLTHGTQSDGSVPVHFPSVPNRWLVTRVVARADGSAPDLESWVVESDRLSLAPVAVAGPQQPTVPVAAWPGQNFRYVGQAFPLAGWQEQAGVERLTPLTALGYGEPTFAAHYPNCCTVFGFHDPVADLSGYDPATCTLSYHVAGWYGDPAADPLAGGRVKSGDNRYHWSFTAGAAPASTVCSGVVDGIAWNPDTRYLGEAPASITAALASSTPEALSALLAATLAKSDPQLTGTEQTLNALQFGLLSNKGTIDQLAAFEEAVHTAGFGSLQGGLLWTVAPKAGGAGAEEVTLPDPVAADLNELNTLQMQLDGLALELQAMQSQLFVDWYKYLLVEYDPEHVPSDLVTQLGTIQAYLATEASAIAALGGPSGTMAGVQAQVTTKAKAIEAELDPSLELSSAQAAPRYYQPGDPVLVVAGADVRPTTRYGGDGASSPDGHLRCRLDGELVTAVGLAAGAVPGSDAVQVTGAELPALAGAPAALLQALLADAILLAPSLQPVVARAAAATGGSTNPAVLDFAATVNALGAAAKAFVAGGATAPATYTGSAPDQILVAGWDGTPWLPILLQYELELTPVQYLEPGTGAYPPGFVNDQFELTSGGVELEFTGTSVQQQVQQYSGTVVLTPSATVDLAGEISRYVKSTGSDKEELEDVVKALRELPLLSQGLSGTGQAMLMRELTLQMPVADPFASIVTQTFVTKVAGAIGGENAVAPMPEESFNPIRAGVLSVTRLRLVDAFGRFKDYTTPDVVVANGLAPPPSLPAAAGQAFLPPRITQPARLRFRWLSSSDDQVETNSHPATSPILGWVVPNHLDESLAIYDAAGTPMGEIGLSGDGKSSLFTPAAGGRFPLGTPIEQVFAGANQHLADFAAGVYDGGDATFLAPFFATIREALAFALPASFAEDAGTSVLLGQPLVLARASLGLDLYGPAATDESWASFAASLAANSPPGDSGLGGVRFPVELGALSQLDDTLVGYWIDTGAGSAGFRDFYSPAAAGAAGGVGPPEQTTLTLTPSFGAGDTTTVTVLMDPRGSVHATSGILPVKSIDIPRDQYGAALAAISATFAIRPLLSGANTGAPAAVQPKVAAGQWAWVQVAGGQWAAQPLTGQPPAQAALDYSPQQLIEGWLALQPAPNPNP